MPTSPCGIPSSAQAYSLNLTAVGPTEQLYLTAWPTGQTLPVAATLNAPAAQQLGEVRLCRPEPTDRSASTPLIRPIW